MNIHKNARLTLNPNTGRGYALTQSLEGPINIFNLADNSVTYLEPKGHGRGPRAVAVSTATNKVFGVFEGEIMVLDAATDAMTWLPASTGVGIALNPSNNKVYVPAADGTLAIINGATSALVKAGIGR